jgi:hypothetical protein
VAATWRRGRGHDGSGPTAKRDRVELRPPPSGSTSWAMAGAASEISLLLSYSRPPPVSKIALLNFCRSTSCWHVIRTESRMKFFFRSYLLRYIDVCFIFSFVLILEILQRNILPAVSFLGCFPFRPYVDKPPFTLKTLWCDFAGYRLPSQRHVIDGPSGMDWGVSSFFFIEQQHLGPPMALWGTVLWYWYHPFWLSCAFSFSYFVF